MEFKFKLSETQRGLLIMTAGLLLIFQSLNILPAMLNMIVIIAAIGMVAYGFVHAGLGDKIQALMKKNK